jgi:hypothetical protein
VTAGMEGEMILHALEKALMNKLARAWSRSRYERPLFERPGAGCQSQFECG